MAADRTGNVRKIAKMMANIDFCMLTTRGGDGRLRGRPMSNNGEVEFDGDVWFFSDAGARKIEDIEGESLVHLSYADPEHFRFVSMTGDAEIVRDVKKKQELWLEELERWFHDGPESEDVVLIKVSPREVTYWNGDEEGEISLD